MVSSYAAKLGRSVIYRRKLIEELGQIEQALASYMAMYELGKIRVNGYFIERLEDGRLDVYEAPALEEHQLELDLGMKKLKQLGMEL